MDANDAAAGGASSAEDSSSSSSSSSISWTAVGCGGASSPKSGSRGITRSEERADGRGLVGVRNACCSSACWCCSMSVASDGIRASGSASGRRTTDGARRRRGVADPSADSVGLRMGGMGGSDSNLGIVGGRGAPPPSTVTALRRGGRGSSLVVVVVMVIAV
ncbi:hypothetical protein AURDEDRAFT_111887 [Auricularia subglabra TFB-10046 SS5]|nr:hypothetical protein AURDEDRAFT_111887 [Auricularia subglabra TFB-10046 SS5]